MLRIFNKITKKYMVFYSLKNILSVVFFFYMLTSIAFIYSEENPDIELPDVIIVGTNESSIDIDKIKEEWESPDENIVIENPYETDEDENTLVDASTIVKGLLRDTNAILNFSYGVFNHYNLSFNLNREKGNRITYYLHFERDAQDSAFSFIGGYKKIPNTDYSKDDFSVLLSYKDPRSVRINSEIIYNEKNYALQDNNEIFRERVRKIGTDIKINFLINEKISFSGILGFLYGGLYTKTTEWNLGLNSYSPLGSIEFKFTWAGWNTLRVRYNFNYILEQSNIIRNIFNTKLFISDSIRIGKIVVIDAGAALVYDTADFFNFDLNLKIKFLIGQKFSLGVEGGRSCIRQDFSTLYYDENYMNYSNLLFSDKFWNAKIFFKATIGNFKMQILPEFRYYAEKLVPTGGNDLLFYYSNKSYFLFGGEVKFSFNPFEALNILSIIKINYPYSIVGDKIPYIALISWNSSLQWNIDRIGLHFAITLILQTDRFSSAGTILSWYITGAAIAEKDIRDIITIYLKINNYTNMSYYLKENYRELPLGISAGVKIRF